MSKRAALIKDCINRIRWLEYALNEDPDSKVIKKLIDEENELLDEIRMEN